MRTPYAAHDVCQNSTRESSSWDLYYSVFELYAVSLSLFSLMDGTTSGKCQMNNQVPKIWIWKHEISWYVVIVGRIHSEFLMWRRAREHHVLVEWRVFRLIVKWHYHGHCWIFRQVVGRDITWSCKHLKTHDQYGPTGSYQHVNSCYSYYRSHHRNEITRQLAARLGLTFFFSERILLSTAWLEAPIALYFSVKN